MTRLLTTTVAATLALGLAAPAAAQDLDELTLQLQWVTQAQFAGYYAALANGYYEDEGLDVTILPGGPDIAPPQVLAGGGADVMLNWMPSALAARERGVPVVNIAQPFTSSGLMLTCWADTGIEGPQDFAGRTIGVWFFGNEYPFLSWMSQEGIPTEEGAEGGVTVLKQGFNVDPLLQRQADCISTMTYNEYNQVLASGVAEDELTTFLYEDQGVATLEDGIYTLEENLEDPEMVDKLARFVRASMRGWEWAVENPEEAAEIIIDYDETGAQTYDHQLAMMEEIAKLVDTSQGGALDEAAYQRTVDTLLAGGSDPVITAAPEGAWTAQVTDAAGEM
ncbi:NitT/TauT family transport system substrate-binding protein [Hasllibacter halocynthiae]|uniref:Thiamine pyrimidine synthase n=1 Tax=Hasllibacter halocynthiae TaxID=595589 RepID=A0A2T0X929_9RHOB|nr:ABC transporter substrate-binding protein [Hasllibacter halocynthiae]PRY95429.1 NitT/TauT family transport system substrate-binding protein [Hasllibacter halocynthiae]